MPKMSEKDLEISKQIRDARVKLVYAVDNVSSTESLDSPSVKKITNPYDAPVDVIGLLYNVEEDIRFPGYLKEKTERHEWMRKLWPKPTRQDYLKKALNMLNDLPKEIKEDRHLTNEEKEILYEAVEYSTTHLCSLMEKAGYISKDKK